MSSVTSDLPRRAGAGLLPLSNLLGRSNSVLSSEQLDRDLVIRPGNLRDLLDLSYSKLSSSEL